MLHALTRAAGALLLVSSSALGSPAGGEDWLADFDVAAAQAREAGKDLLVDFTGSDWCGYCVQLHKEVFDQPRWLPAVRGDYVLVSLDFPRGDEAKAAVPNPARNAELKARYGIDGFPTVLLMTPDGDVFGRTGYRRGGVEPYLQHMASLRREGKAALAEVLVLVRRAEAAEGEAREQALGQVLDRLRRGSRDQAGFFSLLGAARLALAEDLPKTLRQRALGLLLEKAPFDQELFDSALVLDPDNRLGLHERALAALVDTVHDKPAVRAAMPHVARFAALEHHVDPDRASYVLALGAYWAENVVQDHELALRYARRGLAIGNSNGQVTRVLERIVGE